MNADDIVARSITLVDSKGIPRIHLTAESPDGRCSIRLDSPETGGIQIDAAPGRPAAISISAPQMFGALTITAEGITLRSKDGKLGVVVGRSLDGKDDVIVFRDGQIAWRSHEGTSG